MQLMDTEMNIDQFSFAQSPIFFDDRSFQREVSISELGNEGYRFFK